MATPGPLPMPLTQPALQAPIMLFHLSVTPPRHSRASTSTPQNAALIVPCACGTPRRGITNGGIALRRRGLAICRGGGSTRRGARCTSLCKRKARIPM